MRYVRIGPTPWMSTSHPASVSMGGPQYKPANRLDQLTLPDHTDHRLPGRHSQRWRAHHLDPPSKWDGPLFSHLFQSEGVLPSGASGRESSTLPLVPQLECVWRCRAELQEEDVLVGSSERCGSYRHRRPLYYNAIDAMWLTTLTNVELRRSAVVRRKPLTAGMALDENRSFS